jgi:hypothetical protein
MFLKLDQQNKQPIIKQLQYIVNHNTKTFDFGSDIALALKYNKSYNVANPN